MFVILEICGRKTIFYWIKHYFFTFTEMCTCILIEEFDVCLYVSRSMINLLNYAWFYSWFYFDLNIFLWLWYLMYTWLYNELLFLNVFFSFFSVALFASRLQALCGGTMSRIFSGREFRNQSRFSKLMVAISLKITLDLWKAISNNMWWFFFKSRLNLNVQFRDNNFVDFVKHSLLKSTCCCPFIKMY